MEVTLRLDKFDKDTVSMYHTKIGYFIASMHIDCFDGADFYEEMQETLNNGDEYFVKLYGEV